MYFNNVWLLRETRVLLGRIPSELKPDSTAEQLTWDFGGTLRQYGTFEETKLDFLKDLVTQ